MEIAHTIEEPGKLPGDVNLWSLTPSFTLKRFKIEHLFAAYVNGLTERSARDANLIIWIGIRNFADNNFWYPSFDQWIRHGTVLSGSGDRTHLGIVFSNSIENRWGTKILWSPSGGVRCSETCRWVLRKAFKEAGGWVCDPYAKSPHLAVWCRRLGIGYRGYARDKAVRSTIEKELAQTEIPGIQEELPLLIKDGE